MIIGVGCDIVEIARFEKNQENFANRILTPKEKQVYQALVGKRQLEFLAGRFAAKEAIFKANNAFSTISNIEVLNDADGKPICVSDECLVHISIAHEHDCAVAYAICER